MKKLLLSFVALASCVMNVNAQSCAPNPLYTDSTYGVWPDTTTNLPPATQNVFYSANLDFAVPSTVTAELAGNDPAAQAFIGSTINSFTVTSVDGLTPANLQYVCSATNCNYNGGAHGCANVYGTPTQTGTYPVTINISANLTVFFQSIDYPTSFSGYKVVVGTAGIIEQLISPITISPNPANDVINIEGITTSTKAKLVSIVNLEGKIIKSKEVGNDLSISFDLSDVKGGIYFVNVEHASGIETVKFIKY
jgi:hypothetical protein